MAIDITTPTPTNDDVAYKSAYDAVVKAKASGLQADVNAGRDAVNALKGTAGESAMGEFSKQLDVPQQAITNQQTAIQDYVKKFTDNATTTAQAQQQARDALINSRLAGSIADEEANINTENNNYNKTVDQTRSDIYNAQENNRAQGVQRGIQYSQQQQAIEAGTTMQGEKTLQQAQADRDTRIANIKNKIQALKTGASYELQASQAQAQGDIAQAQQTALQTGQNRQWQLDDANTQYQQQLNLKGVDKQTQIDLFNMDEASKEKFFKMDEASKEKFFNMDTDRQKMFFNMDTDRQKMFFDLNEASKEKFWKLDAQQQKEMFSLNAGLQKEMFNLSSEQQVKMLGLENDNKIALANLDAEKQKEIMDYSAKADQKALDAKVKATAQQAKAQTLADYLANRPDFTAYPSVKDLTNPAKVKALSEWMDNQGLTKDQQYSMIKGQMTPSIWDTLTGHTNTANYNLKKILDQYK